MSSISAGTTSTTALVSTADTTGSLVLKTGASATTALTLDTSQNATFAGTVATVTGTVYPLVSGTAQASTSGTSIDFTGIPSTVKRITVMFQSVSTNGISNYLVRIGNTTVTATGYVSTMTYTNISSNSSVGTTDTTGFILTRDTGAAVSFTGIMTICLLSNFVYVASFNASGSSGPTYQGSGFLNLGSVLNRVRITTVNGTDTFDAGTINILWE